MRPRLSVVIVVHDMARELPRTLRTLDASNQQHVDASDYDVVVVDNGSAAELDQGVLEQFSGTLHLIRIDPALPSPAQAANQGLDRAEGDVVGLIIDGARMASPGLLSTAMLATRLARRPVVTCPAWHLGPTAHMRAGEVGYDQAVEDGLLAGSDWERDGYDLFRLSTLAGSSGRGWFGPMGESSSLFLPKEMWTELGGLDERFVLPGGGLVNHDLYRRACSLADSQLVVLLGEGTFHQFHGGAATSRRFTWDDMHAEYQAIKGVAYRPPQNEPLYLGTMPTPALPHIEQSARQAIHRRAKEEGGSAL